MIKEAMEYFLGEARAEHLRVDGTDYFTNSVYLPPKKPLEAPLEINSLTGVVEYLDAHADYLDMVKLLVIVKSPTRVEVMTQIKDNEDRRHLLLVAQTKPPVFNFDSWMDQEAFIASVESRFAPTPDRAEIIKLAGTVVVNASVETEDDGTTTKVTAKQGVQHKWETVKNPVMLAPYRSFPEIEPVESPFVFRIRESSNKNLRVPVEFLLAEADNGRWAIETRHHIAEFVKKHGHEYCLTLA